MKIFLTHPFPSALLVFVLAAAIILAGCVTADKRSSGRIKVLIVDGYSNRAW